MGTRLELHEELCTILGSRNVYFQPPESIKMQYPCIVYNPAYVNIQRADNKAYRMTDKYNVQYITKEADDTLYHDMLKHFEICSFDRYFRADGLHHYTTSLYY